MKFNILYIVDYHKDSYLFQKKIEIFSNYFYKSRVIDETNFKKIP